MTFQYLQDHFDLLQELAQTRELLAHTAKKLSSSPELRSSLEVVQKDLLLEEAKLVQITQEQTAQIQAYIESLSDVKLRTILYYRYISGLSWKEVAYFVGRGSTENSVQRKTYVHFKKLQ